MRILLVEDEVRLSEAVVHLLKKNNHTVDAVYDGEDGYDFIMSDIYDVVILDVMLPSMNGFDILKRVREEGITTPIIMLTARSQISDRVLGLDNGADDYLSKPFSMDELIARIRALGRRKAKQYESDVKTIGDIEYDVEKSIVYNDSKTIHLTHLENELFQLLVERLNLVTSKERIIIKLWGYDSDAEDNNVEVYISFLRKKLKFISEFVTIKTKRSIGYILEVNKDV